MIYRWKFLRKVDGKIKSENGKLTWQIGKWKTHRGKLEMCKSGLHCSKGVYQAFSYIQGEVLAKVECGGKSIIQKDKEVYSKMKIVEAYKWQKKDSVSLAIYAAKLVLPIFEKKYPKDKRPRKAIQVAVRYLKSPTEKNRLATWAAGAAAWAAGVAAGAAAWAAGVATGATGATGAAEAAEVAAWAAGAAEAAAGAAGAAEAAVINKIAKWMDKRVSKLEGIK